MKTARIVGSVTTAVLVWTLAASAQKPKTIELNVELVQIPVTVNNSNGRYITGLQAEHFRLWEDKVEQKLLYFTMEEAPMSLVIVLDTSASMTANRQLTDRTAANCLKTGVKQDEYSLILFSSKPHPPTEFTPDIRTLQDQMLFLNSKGWTALYDAIYSGLITAETGINPRKAIVVLTDGYENHSRRSARELIKMVREKNIVVYSYGNTGDGALRELTEITGGRQVRYASNLPNICSEIVRELKTQYLLSYRSTNSAKDGRWRNVRVQLTLPRELQLSTRTKTGYFAGSGNER